MSDVVWNLGSDGLHAPQEALFDALGTGVILGGSSSSFTMKDGPEVVIFQGSFTLANGVITAGTISGFRVYYNSPADKLMDVSGYSIDFNAFKQALAARQRERPWPAQPSSLRQPDDGEWGRPGRSARKQCSVALREIISTAMAATTLSATLAAATSCMVARQ